MSEEGQGRTILATPVRKNEEAEASADWLIGKVLAGRYTIERKLGEGGMGSVYIARHNTLDKQVAVKILHGEYARKPDLIERFLQEARAASRIRHENVIDITDFGTTDDGLVFFCMELLSGQDLHELLTRARIEGEPLPWSRSGPIFLQVCAALAAAHENGVIHRDLKPENIFLIEWLGTSDFVKLLDFGIAKMTEVEEGEGERKLTKTGMLFGTPEYMSPEQARGDKPDARVDVYAMGCILYQLLIGETPFTGDSFMAVLSQHLTAEPPVVTPEQLSAVGAPAGLAAVVARTLVKDRDQRYGSVRELADAVRAACSGQPVAVPNPAGSHQVATPPAPPAEAVPEPVATGGESVWTGSARIPSEVEQARAGAAETVKTGAHHNRTARTLWLMVAAVVIIGGGVVGAVALTTGGDRGDGGETEPAEPAITAPDPGETETAPAPAPAPAPETAPAPAPETAPAPARETAPETETKPETRPQTTPVKPDPEPAPEPDPKPDPEPDDDPKPGEVKTKNPFD